MQISLLPPIPMQVINFQILPHLTMEDCMNCESVTKLWNQHLNSDDEYISGKENYFYNKLVSKGQLVLPQGIIEILGGKRKICELQFIKLVDEEPNLKNITASVMRGVYHNNIPFIAFKITREEFNPQKSMEKEEKGLFCLIPHHEKMGAKIKIFDGFKKSRDAIARGFPLIEILKNVLSGNYYHHEFIGSTTVSYKLVANKKESRSCIIC